MITIKELKNTGNFMDNQDPQLKITIGSKVFNTKRY